MFLDSYFRQMIFIFFSEMWSYVSPSDDCINIFTSVYVKGEIIDCGEHE